MKPHPETFEGPESWTRFTGAMGKILSVSKEELNRREAEYRKASLANPKRRGPKPKTSAHGPAEQPQV